MRAAPASGTSPDDEDHTVGWIVLGLGLLLTIPTGAVIWAHS